MRTLTQAALGYFVGVRKAAVPSYGIHEPESYGIHEPESYGIHEPESYGIHEPESYGVLWHS